MKKEHYWFESRCRMFCSRLFSDRTECERVAKAYVNSTDTPVILLWRRENSIAVIYGCIE